jgi:hypothetical protein
VIITAMIASPSIAIVYIGSYYVGSMTHATYIWVFMNMNIGVFIECIIGSETRMDASTLHEYALGRIFMKGWRWRIQLHVQRALLEIRKYKGSMNWRPSWRNLPSYSKFPLVLAFD